MADYCVLIPKVKTATGEFKESKLFKDLLSLTSRNRKEAVTLYSLLKDKTFQENHSSVIKFDDYGEPILSSVLGNVEVKGILDDTITARNLAAGLGALDEQGNTIYMQDNYENYTQLATKATQFNTASSFKDNFVALVRTENEKVGLVVERLNEENQVIAKKIASSLSLNEKLRTILANSGISIGALTSLQDKLTLNGLVDYENASYTAEGLIELVRLADGSRGEKALPEEFSHFVLDAMSDDPLIQRLYNLLDNEAIIKQVLGEDYSKYDELYGSNRDRLIRESAGKLLHNSLVLGQEQLPEYKTFLQRLFGAIKAFIKSKLNPTDINQAINEASQVAGQVAARVLSDERVSNVELKKLKRLSNLAQLSRNSKTAEQILQKSTDNELKKYSFYIENLERRIRAAKDEDEKDSLQRKLEAYQLKAKEFIGQQNNFFRSADFNQGILNFISYSAGEMEDIVTKLQIIISGEMSLRGRAFQLRNIKNFLDSNEATILAIQEAIVDPESGITVDETAKARLTSLAASLSQARQILSTQTRLTFSSFLEKFMPSEGVSITSKGKTKHISREDIASLLETAEHDISLLDTWVQSTAEADDIILKLADKAMKSSKERKRLRVLKVQRELLSAAKALKDAGIPNTEFMFETHSDGKMSRRYVSDTNWTAFRDAKYQMLQDLDKKYGKNPSGKDADRKIAERSQWYRDNVDSVGFPVKEKYGVNLETKFSGPQMEYYKAFMKVRDEMLSYLPDTLYREDPYRAVQITKDLWERLKSSSPETWYKQIWTSAKDQVITKVDDTEFGSVAKRNFEDREVMSVPIFFINNVEDEASLSRDTVSTMLAFSDMAINYDEMVQVADYFELGREAMSADQRKAEVLRNGKPLSETLNVLGQKVSAKVREEGSNFAARYNEFLRSQLYGRYMKDSNLYEGENFEIKANKVAKLLNKISSLNQLALNGLAGIAAVGNDMINVNSEALAGQYFSAKDLRDADGIYFRELPKVLGEAQNPIKTSKLGLFIQTFDVLHEYEADIRDIEWDKSRTKKFLSSNSLYIFMHAGSHFGETRTALAQAKKIKIKSDDGTREESLWDILEVEYLDAAHPERGAKLKTKDGFSLSEADIKKYTRQFMGLNERLFGIYNQADRNALQSTAIGQLVFLYRKFMVPAINRRFGGANYNLDLNQETEGYYRSFGHFIWNVAKDSQNLGHNIKMYWNSMSDNERANCIRATNELGTFTVLAVLTSVLSAADWDKKDNPWHRRFLAYMTRRMKTEVGAFTPVGIFNETWNIVKSPAAAINTLESAGDILGVINPWNYEDIGGEEALVQSGRYKGHNKAYRYLMNSPFVPMNKTIYKMAHPEESIIAFR